MIGGCHFSYRFSGHVYNFNITEIEYLNRNKEFFSENLLKLVEYTTKLRFKKETVIFSVYYRDQQFDKSN